MSQEILELFVNNINSDAKLKALKKEKETGSMVEILGIPSSQSFTIRLGNTIEKCFKEYIELKAESVSKIILSNRQADLYFNYNNKLYYFEVKNNVNLDTEKTAEVVAKLNEAKGIVNIVGCLSFRSDTKEILKKFAKPPLFSYLYGYNDFFNIFEDNLAKEEYEIILHTIKNIFISSLRE